MMSTAATAANAGCVAVIEERAMISRLLAAMAAEEASWTSLRPASLGCSKVGATEVVEVPDIGAVKSG